MTAVDVTFGGKFWENSDTRNVDFWRGLDQARCAVSTFGLDRTSRSVSTSPKTDITLMTHYLIS